MLRITLTDERPDDPRDTPWGTVLLTPRAGTAATEGHYTATLFAPTGDLVDQVPLSGPPSPDTLEAAVKLASAALRKLGQALEEMRDA